MSTTYNPHHAASFDELLRMIENDPNAPDYARELLRREPVAAEDVQEKVDEAVEAAVTPLVRELSRALGDIANADDEDAAARIEGVRDDLESLSVEVDL